MDYSEDELNYIGSKKPEYKLEPVPSLDFVVVKFLEKYEVYVRPASSSKSTARDVGSSAIAGAIGGAIGGAVENPISRSHPSLLAPNPSPVQA